MNVSNSMNNEIDDYIATFSDEERKELAAADAALDLALLLRAARSERGLSQSAAAARAGMQQQAISRWEQSIANVQLASLQRYLEALGFTLDIGIRDSETGALLGSALLAQP